ncbi:MAG: putative O-glycosylation ligase, exosortase A system-associated [Planctomycetes bacterium]|nr:putative O-glycosylation ligase, exosortase A system-associated [Planctomycetota bacterium]
MRDLLVFVLVLLSLPTCFRRPFVGLLVFTWLSYMRPQDLCWGFARTIRFSLYVGITMIAGYWARERGERPFFKRNAGSTAMLALLLLTYLSTIPARKVDSDVFNGLFEFTKIVVVALFTIGQVDTRTRIRTLGWVIAVSLGFFGVKGGINGIATGGGAIHQGPGGMLEDNNDFALGMVMCLPFLFYLGSAEAKKFVRLGAYVACGLSVVTIILTHSRGGFLALSTVFLMMAWRSGKLFRATVVLGTFVTVFFLFAPQSVIDRYDTIDDVKVGRQDGSVEARLVSWGVAWEMVKDDPLLGIGFRNFEANYVAYAAIAYPGVPVIPRVTHNSYLQIWSENGTPALVFFVVVLLSVFVVSHRTRALARRHGDMDWAIRYANMAETSIFGFLVGGFFLNRGHFDLTYQVVGFASAIYFTARAHAVLPADAADPVVATPGGPVAALVPRPVWGRATATAGAPRWARTD